MSESSPSPHSRPTPIRVVLVDDDPLVRAGLTMILGGAPDLAVVGEAVDGIDAESVVARLRPDLVLMDIRMPQRDGLEATRVILGAAPAPKVIMLTTFEADDMVLQALRAGASGFLLKDTPPAQLVEAVRAVAAGQPILSPSVTATLISHVAMGTSPAPGAVDPRRSKAAQRLAVLTEREREVAAAVGRGLSNQEIAAELYMGVPTVKAHVSSILAKLGAENRVQVAILVHDAGE